MLNRRTLVPLALLLTLFGCGGGGGNMKAKEYKGHFEDAKQGLIFQCPTSWDIRENVEGHRVIARSPRDPKEDKFQENLVVSGPIAAASQEEIHGKAEAEFKKLDHYQAQPAPGDILDFDYQFEGQDLHGRAYIWKIKDKNEYWLAQFTDAKADWPAHEAVFVQIMSSWGMAPGTTPTPIVQPAVQTSPSATPAAVTATPAANSTPVASATPVASPTPAATATPTSPTPTPAVGAPTATSTPK